METVGERVVKNVTLRGVLRESLQDRSIRVTFVNRDRSPVWLPQEKTPAYRMDEEKHRLTISYGYFEEVYGPYRERYMLPQMQMVAPDQKYSWEITQSELVTKAFDPGVETIIQARLALHSLRESNVRGQQDLDAYIKSSCVIRSGELTKE